MVTSEDEDALEESNIDTEITKKENMKNQMTKKMVIW